MASEKIKQFNEIISSFLIQISPLIGTTYHTKLEEIIKYNSLLPIEQFLVHALPVRDKILERDVTYFTDATVYTEKIDSTGNKNNTENILSEILRLQDIYTKLDETSKSNVWDIFQAMLILGEEYLKIKIMN